MLFHCLTILSSYIPSIILYSISIIVDKKFSILSLCNITTSLFIGYKIDSNIITSTSISPIILIPFLYLFFLIQSSLFYIFHLFLHKKLLFRTIHYIHHQHITDGWWTAFHFHPIELLLVLTTFHLPKLIYLYIPIPISVIIIWNIVGSLYFILSHGSIKQPFVDLRNHNFHHQYYTCNYSSEWIDRLCGTYKL